MQKYYISSLLILGVLTAILGVNMNTLAAPSNPPPNGYTGGLFSVYFENIIRGSGALAWTTSTGVCPPGQVIGGFSVNPSTYGLPICTESFAIGLTGSLRGTVNYLPKYGATNTGIVNSQIFDNGTNVGIATGAPGAKLDVNGIARLGSTVHGYNWVQANGATQRYKIATLPISGGGTYDHLVLEGVFDDNWGSTNKSYYHIMMSNRNGFAYKWNAVGDIKNNARILAYQEADGSVSVWSSLSGSTYSSISLNITESVLVTTYPSPSNGTPTGTLVFDSSSSTYKPLSILNSSGNMGIGTSTPGQKLDVSSGSIRTTHQLISTVANGTAPLAVTSTTRVNNLNVARAGTADQLTTTRTINGTNFNGTANIEVTRTTSKGIMAASTGRTVLDTGIYTYNTNNSSLGAPTPTSYWSTIGWGRGVGGSAELAASWTSNGNELYFRSLRDTTDDWWAWKKIFHTGNDGSGSTLDADLLDGQNSSYYAPVTNINGTTNYLAKFTGTNTVGGSLLYDNSVSVGIGTILPSPSARLEVNGQVKITGGSPALGRVLTSDATGLATWQDPSVTESDPKVGTLTSNYIPKWNGTTLASGLMYDNGNTIAIGTGTPNAAAKLDVIGRVKITDGSQGSGKVLYGDANGLASWGDLPADLPVGTVMAFNSTSCPAGWAIADGTSGTPDLRGEFIRGLDSGRGVDSGRVLGSWQTDIFKSHQHMETSVANNPPDAPSQRKAPWGQSTVTSSGVQSFETADSTNPADGNEVFYFTSGTGGTETRPRNVALLYCMKISTYSAPAPLTWYNTTSTASGDVALATTGKVGVGTTTPTEKLEVQGSIKVVDGNQGSGKVLVSDAAGKGTWQEMPGDLPVGSIMAFNGTVCPAGWVIANGVGGTPDLRGEFIRGLDSGRGVDTGRTLASAQAQDWKGFSMTNTLANVNTGYSHYNVSMGKSTSAYVGNLFTGKFENNSVAIGTMWDNTSEIRPRNVALLYCQKVSVAPATPSNSVTWMNVDGTLTGRVVLATTGNVGIGTAAPTAKLDIVDATNMPATPAINSVVPLKISNGTTEAILIDSNQIESVGGGLHLNFRPTTQNTTIAAGGGNVGIGTASPGSGASMNGGLTINGSNSTQMTVEKNGIPGFALNTSNGAWTMFDRSTGAWNSSITSSGGNVGIGTNTPGAKLDISGHSRTTSFEVMDAGTPTISLHKPGTYATQIKLNGSNQVSFGGWSAGEGQASILAGAFYYGSDRRLKEDIMPLKNTLEKVLSLNGYSFSWKKDGRKDIGVIAQEIEQVFPELVSTNSETGMKSVQYGNLVAPIIEAIKELATQVKSLHMLIEEQQSDIRKLQSENAELKARLDAIEARLAQ